MSLQTKLSQRVDDQRQKRLYRQHRIVSSPQQIRLTVDGRELTNFCSNDYLGLANHPEVNAAFIKGVETYGAGSGAAHLINGHSKAHQQLEEELAEFVGAERALLFSTGYMANVGVLAGLTDRHDVIYQDKLNHASLIDGGLQSRANAKRYRHIDTQDLQRQLDTENCETGLIATDGVFSMEGDIAPLAELNKMAGSKNYMLYVDDAHGIGVQGEWGSGSLSAANLTPTNNIIYMATLGKALGTFGAFVAGDADMIDALVQFSRSYVYTTAPPPAIAEATRASLKVVKEDNERQERLKRNISYFQSCANELKLSINQHQTSIQPIKVESVEAATKLQLKLEAAGYLVSAIRPPTVPEPCVRITLSSEHQTVDIDGLLSTLSEALADE